MDLAGPIPQRRRMGLQPALGSPQAPDPVAQLAAAATQNPLVQLHENFPILRMNQIQHWTADDLPGTALQQA